MDGGRTPLLPGYHVKILDGNHLAGTEHRLKELRTIRAGALPGHALVVLDPGLMLATDVILCEDGHAQERSLLDQVLEIVRARDLWIEDRNFCKTNFLFGITGRDAFFGAETCKFIQTSERAAMAETLRVTHETGGPPRSGRGRCACWECSPGSCMERSLRGGSSQRPQDTATSGRMARYAGGLASPSYRSG